MVWWLLESLLPYKSIIYHYTCSSDVHVCIQTIDNNPVTQHLENGLVSLPILFVLKQDVFAKHGCPRCQQSQNLANSLSPTIWPWGLWCQWRNEVWATVTKFGKNCSYVSPVHQNFNSRTWDRKIPPEPQCLEIQSRMGCLGLLIVGIVWWRYCLWRHNAYLPLHYPQRHRRFQWCWML